MKLFKNWYQIIFSILLIIYMIFVFYQAYNLEYEAGLVFMLLTIGISIFVFLYGFGELIYYASFNEKITICKHCNSKNPITKEYCYMCGKSLSEKEINVTSQKNSSTNNSFETQRNNEK